MSWRITEINESKAMLIAEVIQSLKWAKGKAKIEDNSLTIGTHIYYCEETTNVIIKLNDDSVYTGDASSFPVMDLAKALEIARHITSVTTKPHYPQPWRWIEEWYKRFNAPAGTNYKLWFWERINSDPNFLADVNILVTLELTEDIDHPEVVKAWVEAGKPLRKKAC